MMKKRKIIGRIALILVCLLAGFCLLYASACLIRYQTLKDTGLPRIDVTTENGAEILSKTEYVNCTVSISGTEEDFCLDEAEAGIRGRGNDTWLYYPKKPYRIKFQEKTSVFGEAKNKSWVLLALYNDFSMIKDNLAFTMADAVEGQEFAPAHHYVELYLNGRYCGLYLLTDQVDENKGRAGVKADFTPEDREVPFLVELDARAPEEGIQDVDWFYAGGRPYAIKYPEADERYTPEQFQYIKDYIVTVDTLCRTENVSLEELEEWIDLESFLDYYLVQEVMGQPEINWKSVYMSKTADGKLKMGPVWDFDWAAMGPSTGRHRNEYRDRIEEFRSIDNWFAALYQGSPAFREALAERWEEIRPELLSAIEQVEEESQQIEKAAKRDRLRWHWYRLGGGFDTSSKEVFAWCRKRIAWLDEELGS